jgi:hypothetical protein
MDFKGVVRKDVSFSDPFLPAVTPGGLVWKTPSYLQ